MAGVQCCENAPAPNPPNVGVGLVEQWQHLTVYVTGSPDTKKAAILVSDIFGFDKPIFRKLADKVAAAGYFVVVPDYLYGDPYVVRDYSNPFADFPNWINIHGPDKGVIDSKVVIEELKARGISAIGAGGFCWGAKVVVGLLNGNDLNVGVLVHPSYVTEDDIKEVKAPIAILGAEIDQRSPPELIRKFEEILLGKPEVNSFVTIYPGVAHGWAVRYDEKDENAVKRAAEVHDKFIELLNTHVAI